MTNGIIRNKATGLEIPVENYIEYNSVGGSYFWATMEGDTPRQWNSAKWEFIPATPSLREQFDALPIGAAFVEDESFLKQGGFYIKVSADAFVFTNSVAGYASIELFDKTRWSYYTTKNLYRKEIK